MVEISRKNRYGLVFSGEFSRSARLFLSATAYSLVSASYFTGMDLTAAPSQAQAGIDQMSNSEMQQLLLDVSNLPITTLVAS